MRMSTIHEKKWKITKGQAECLPNEETYLEDTDQHIKFLTTPNHLIFCAALCAWHHKRNQTKQYKSISQHRFPN